MGRVLLNSILAIVTFASCFCVFANTTSLEDQLHRIVQLEKDLSLKGITYDKIHFQAFLIRSAKFRQLSLTRFSGFEFAEYKNEQIKLDLKLLSERYAEEQGAISIQLINGSNKGLGVAFPYLSKKNTVVAAIMPAHLLDRHFEESKTGGLISPHLDYLYFIKRDSIDATDSLFDFERYRSVHKIRWNIFEGEESTFREVLEFIMQRHSGLYRATLPKSELLLVVGYEPENEKLNNEYFAATQAATLLRDYPELRPQNLTVKIAVAGDVTKTYSLDDFFKTPYGSSERFQTKNSSNDVLSSILSDFCGRAVEAYSYYSELKQKLIASTSNSTIANTLHIESSERVINLALGILKKQNAQTRKKAVSRINKSLQLNNLLNTSVPAQKTASIWEPKIRELIDDMTY